MTRIGILLVVASTLVTFTAPALAWALFGVAAAVELLGVPIARGELAEIERREGASV
jgi:hypothetical protein